MGQENLNPDCLARDSRWTSLKAKHSLGVNLEQPAHFCDLSLQKIYQVLTSNIRERKTPQISDRGGRMWTFWNKPEHSFLFSKGCSQERLFYETHLLEIYQSQMKRREIPNFNSHLRGGSWKRGETEKHLNPLPRDRCSPKAETYSWD